MAGLLLLGGAAAEITQGFRRRTAVAQRSAWVGGAYTLLLALLLLNAAGLVVSALAIFVAVPFAVDGLRQLGVALRQAARRQSFLHAAWAAVWNLAVMLGVLLLRRVAVDWVVALAAGLRLVGTTTNLVTAPVHSEREADESVIADIGIERPERLTETGARLQSNEVSRVAADRGWIAALLAVLFTIHVSRMGLDKSALAVLSPLVAVIGDVVVALGLAYFVIVPLRLLGRRLTRGLERGAWERILDAPARRGPMAWAERALRAWLESRMRFAIRLRSARYSLRSAFGRGLQIGLPMAAVIVASVPIWGMSWYFDTENWAAGIWNSWAAARTDAWRAAMVRAVVDAGETTLDGKGFTVSPEGLTDSKPFSFIVIGDTGEGDASQDVLRDSLIRAAAADDVRFVILSSDVVYPTGAMRDYETRFWLPFKGVLKPVYAIPGNHDWYDALEGLRGYVFPARGRPGRHARPHRGGRRTVQHDGREDRGVHPEGGLPASRIRRGHWIPAGALLSGADASVRARRRGHGRAAACGRRGAEMASRGTRCVAREDGNGRPRAPAPCRWPRRRHGRRRVHGRAQHAPRIQRAGRDGGRHARPRILSGARGLVRPAPSPSTIG